MYYLLTITFIWPQVKKTKKKKSISYMLAPIHFVCAPNLLMKWRRSWTKVPCLEVRDVLISNRRYVWDTYTALSLMEVLGGYDIFWRMNFWIRRYIIKKSLSYRFLFYDGEIIIYCNSDRVMIFNYVKILTAELGKRIKGRMNYL